MCGFAGLVTFGGRRPDGGGGLEAVSPRLACRGPDGRGDWLNRPGPGTRDEPRVEVTFRRLAVLDPAARADQPMHTPDGRYTLVFNGEIYNFRQLREELSRLHSTPWLTTGDTEVLLHALAAWGTDALVRLNGMFALALWDAATNTLLLARDRMGQKPLYTTWDGTRAYFGSVPQAPGFPDDAELAGYLRHGYIRQDELAPGSWLRLTADGPSTGVYYACNERGSGGVAGLAVSCRARPTRSAAAKAESARVDVAGVVRRAVERQLVSDRSLGVFLSGGIDSSVVALCAQRAAGDVRTFSVRFGEGAYDETPYALAVAKHLGTRHEVFDITPAVVEDLPAVVTAFGEPFADSSALPTWYLCRETVKHVTVALSGDGGDELFGGYDRYVAMRLSARARHVPAWLRRALVGRFLGGHPKGRLTRLARLLEAADLAPARRYARFMRLFTDAQIRELAPHLPDVPDRAEQVFRTLEKTHCPVSAAAATDRVTYLPDDLLRKVDRCSMAHGLEVRSPFMDPDVLGVASGLTGEQLVGGGKKRLLREAFAGELPRFVFRRRKMGFAVPVGTWFRGPLREYLHEHLLAADGYSRRHFAPAAVEQLLRDHDTGRFDHAQRLWALLVLEVWARHVGESSGRGC
ncbi:MAG: asparagine synthase (glutamine-hydrolyzing) [Phycisphaerae bacterium]